MSFRVIGTGSSLPKRVVTNDDLSQFLDTSDEWIYSRTGIKQRHVCTTEGLDDLAQRLPLHHDLAHRRRGPQPQGDRVELGRGGAGRVGLP